MSRCKKASSKNQCNEADVLLHSFPDRFAAAPARAVDGRETDPHPHPLAVDAEAVCEDVVSSVA